MVRLLFTCVPATSPTKLQQDVGGTSGVYACATSCLNVRKGCETTEQWKQEQTLRTIVERRGSLHSCFEPHDVSTERSARSLLVASHNDLRCTGQRHHCREPQCSLTNTRHDVRQTSEFCACATLCDQRSSKGSAQEDVGKYLDMFENLCQLKKHRCLMLFFDKTM